MPPISDYGDHGRLRAITAISQVPALIILKGFASFWLPPGINRNNSCADQRLSAVDRMRLLPPQSPNSSTTAVGKEPTATGRSKAETRCHARPGEREWEDSLVFGIRKLPSLSPSALRESAVVRSARGIAEVVELADTPS